MASTHLTENRIGRKIQHRLVYSHLAREQRLTRLNLTDEDAQLKKAGHRILPAYDAHAVDRRT